ncbi:hypothetical protein [Photobacterium leiognathi]|uniref:hypothetical protein n=1 Tax=Photobacterium leiognathi TaxID=553611 RepID=UPI00273859E8|nr:hypothetical protein [Photobacterium leiognathi]
MAPKDLTDAIAALRAQVRATSFFIFLKKALGMDKKIKRRANKGLLTIKKRVAVVAVKHLAATARLKIYILKLGV